MKTRGWMAGVLVVVGGLVAPVAARAQDAVLVVRSAGELLDDMQYLAKSVGAEEQAGPIEGMIENLKEQGLKGLDLAKPIGLMATLPQQPGEAPMVVAAVPTTDLPTLLQSLQGLGVQSQPFEGEPGFTHQVVLPDGATTVFVTSASGYAYFSMLPKGAKEIQALRPSGWAPKRPGAGDISLTVRLDRLPARIRQSAIDAVAQQAEAEQDREPGESEAEYQGRRAVTRLVGEAMTRFLEDAGTVALDLTVGQEEEEVSLALSVSGKPGTPMAKAIGNFEGRESRFSALGADAPLAGWASLPVPKEFQDLMGKLMEEGRKEAVEKAESDAEKKVANEVIDAIKQTLMNDSIDIGLSMRAEGSGGKPVLVSGMQVADGKEFETALLDALKASPPDADTKVTLDAAKASDGTSIHKIQGKVDEDTARIFGKDAAAFLAFQDDAMFVVVGEAGREAMDRAIAASGKKAKAGALPPAAVVMHAAKMAPFVRDDRNEGVGPKEAQKAAAEVFQGKNASKDLLRLSVHGQGGTVFLRLSCDVPVLSFFVKVGAARQQAEIQPANP